MGPWTELMEGFRASLATRRPRGGCHGRADGIEARTFRQSLINTHMRDLSPAHAHVLRAQPAGGLRSAKSLLAKRDRPPGMGVLRSWPGGPEQPRHEKIQIYI
jgi:hypothetical protein